MFVAREPDSEKFPARVVIILSLCMTVNTYSVVSLLAYVGVMVKDLLDLETTNESGFYAGYLGSAYMLGRFVGGYALGRIADFVGRKPVMISGLISIAAFSLTFGLSTSFSFAIGSRLILGLTNGITPALRTTLREVCGEEHVLRGMTYLSGSKAFCLVLGTGIGGLLAQPAVNYPSLFSGEGILGRYPFLLPNLAGSIWAVILLPLVVLYIPETKDFPRKDAAGELSRDGRGTEHGSDGEASGEGTACATPEGSGGDRLSYQELEDENGGDGLPQQGGSSPGSEMQEADNRRDEAVGIHHSDSDSDSGDELVKEKEEPGVWGPDGLLAIPNVKMVLFLACAVQTLNICFEEVFPLWALSTRDVGGLGWDTIEIGKVFLVAGLIVAALLFFLFPPAIKVLGVASYQRLGCLVGIPAFIAVPNARSLSWNHTGVFMVSVAGTVLIYCCQAMVTLTLVIASTNMVRANMRGKLAGLYNAAESFGCFLGPVGSANLFAWSISPSTYSWVDHHFVFIAAALSLVVVMILAWSTLTEENIMTSAEPRGAVDAPATWAAEAREGAGGASLPVNRPDVEADLV